MADRLPPWLAKWWRGYNTGLSSKYIAAIFCSVPAVQQITEVAAPWDTSDVGRCVRLLDLASANGCDWRGGVGSLAMGRATPEVDEVRRRYDELGKAIRGLGGDVTRVGRDDR